LCKNISGSSNSLCVISNYIDHGYKTQPSLYACNFLRLLKRMIIFNTKIKSFQFSILFAPNINGGSVNQLMIKHLSTQGESDPKGGLR
jgi:hypothetical protein